MISPKCKWAALLHWMWVLVFFSPSEIQWHFISCYSIREMNFLKHNAVICDTGLSVPENSIGKIMWPEYMCLVSLKAHNGERIEWRSRYRWGTLFLRACEPARGLKNSTARAPLRTAARWVPASANDCCLYNCTGPSTILDTFYQFPWRWYSLWS